VGDVWNDITGTTAVIRGYVIEYLKHPDAAILKIEQKDQQEVLLTWGFQNEFELHGAACGFTYRSCVGLCNERAGEWSDQFCTPDE
jgi:hypothetical protein